MDRPVYKVQQWETDRESFYIWAQDEDGEPEGIGTIHCPELARKIEQMDQFPPVEPEIDEDDWRIGGGR